jgi:glyoxylase I family protein
MLTPVEFADQWRRTSHPSSHSGWTDETGSGQDPVQSAAWYASVLGLEQRYDFTSDDGSMRYICLAEASSGLVLCLVGHAANTGEVFSEFRTGLDHLEFLVPRRQDLHEWAERLDDLGVPHSGVKNLDYTSNAMVVFRDPDNIQLEFFWRAPAEPDT